MGEKLMEDHQLVAGINRREKRPDRNQGRDEANGDANSPWIEREGGSGAFREIEGSS